MGQKIMCYALVFWAEEHGLSTLCLQSSEELVWAARVAVISERYSKVDLCRSVHLKCHKGCTDRLDPL
jgi:hypothetical protein